MAAVDWNKVYERFQRAVASASANLGVKAEALNGKPLLLDVRRKRVYEKSTVVLPGAEWRDPDRVADSCDSIRKDRPVVVYCIYGHEVGRSTAPALRARGVDARVLDGGITAWQSAGYRVGSKEASA